MLKLLELSAKQCKVFFVSKKKKKRSGGVVCRDVRGVNFEHMNMFTCTSMSIGSGDSEVLVVTLAVWSRDIDGRVCSTLAYELNL